MQLTLTLMMISFTWMHDHTSFHPAVGTYDMTDPGFKQFTIISFSTGPQIFRMDVVALYWNSNCFTSNVECSGCL